MKSQFKGFISGALVSALVLGGAVSALAATGRMTITVDPINIQVNGQTFQPTDVNGNAVPVFAYNGTTYAPLRALAEAYGLTVGYDGEKQMATVTDPEVKPITNDGRAQENLPVDNNGKAITDFEVDTRGGLYIAGEEIISDAPKNIVVGALDYYNFELAASYLAPDRSFDPEYYMGLTHIWTNKYFTYKGYHFIPALELIEYLGLHRADCKYDKDTGLHLMEGN